jgi:hypothetical protein
VGIYVIALRAWGAECAQRLGAVKGLVTPTP